ncbi:MAG: type I methionyl aminopeptidase [Candidatus Aenigmarchaeota archaeon]|nr:type I methionyl aminopeptidase [Candidatus Aenigmarchaeota archaeon]
MIQIKNKSEIEKMRSGGKILAEIMSILKDRTRPGITAKSLDVLANRLCLKYKVKPSFLNYRGYPASLCVSLNEEIVHGLPNNRVLQEGDLVSLDLGVNFQGYHTDRAITVFLGDPSPEIKKLITVTQKALELGLKKAIVGNRIGDISHIIQEAAEKERFQVIRDLVGHGIGKEVHEDPAIPNFGNPDTGPLIETGMTLAIEPMISLGEPATILKDDGWAFVTRDQSLTAHFEHTVLVTDDGPEILTDLD